MSDFKSFWNVKHFKSIWNVFLHACLKPEITFDTKLSLHEHLHRDGLTSIFSAFRIPYGDKSSVQGFQFSVLKFCRLSKRIFRGFELVSFFSSHFFIISSFRCICLSCALCGLLSITCDTCCVCIHCNVTISSCFYLMYFDVLRWRLTIWLPGWNKSLHPTIRNGST